MKYEIIDENEEEDYFENNVYNPSIPEIILWFIISITCGVTSNLDYYASGLHIQITVHDFLWTFATTICLLLGLKKNMPICIIPWLIMTFWNMLTCQYFSFEEITSAIFHSSVQYSLTGTLSLLAGITSLGLRIFLWTKIFQIAYFNNYEHVVEHEDKSKYKFEIDDFEFQYLQNILHRNNQKCKRGNLQEVETQKSANIT